MAKEKTMEPPKMVKLYDKNGNPRDIREAQKAQWLKNGWSLTPPKKEEEK